jgi:hypothetical protein
LTAICPTFPDGEHGIENFIASNFAEAHFVFSALEKTGDTDKEIYPGNPR